MEELKHLAVVFSLGSGAVMSKEGFRALKKFLRTEIGAKKVKTEVDADQLNHLT